jgi:hypothetical protein
MFRKKSAVRRIAFLSLLVACGSRTGLFGVEDGLGNQPGQDGGPAFQDGGPDGRVTDGPPPLDVRPPTDVFRADCPDANALLVYTMTVDGDLQSFNPDNGQFRNIGRIACPLGSVAGNTPFSMAVDRAGIAYVLFRDSRLYRVSTLNAACISTSYINGQSGFQLFGMGFATNAGGPTETLYVAGDDQDNAQGVKGRQGFARIAPGPFNLTLIGDAPDLAQAELTGTGDGRVFAFYSKQENRRPPSFIGEVDIQTGNVVGERQFDTITQGEAWAFAFWGGDFYMFHAPDGPTRVTRFRPSDGSVTQVATSAAQIVGAGVSTCAPQQ